MNNLPVLSEYFEGEPIEIRGDGYWDATLMCQKYGKNVNDFFRLKSTKAYLDELSLDTGIAVSNLVETILGKGVQQGTWVHPQVALKLAAWLSPRFEVWVFKVIKKLFEQGKVELEEEISVLNEMLEKSLYDRDELRRDLPWHRQNSWGAEMDDITPHD